MSLDLKISIVLSFISGSLALLYFFMKKWRRRNRRSDRRPLGYQKKISQQAQALAQSKNFLGAAQLYESIGMQREAINLLEENGLIKEACAILLRMRLPNRAGIIFARHAEWQRAADCFEQARMSSEAAKCAREAGDVVRAVKNYVEARQFKEAAEGYHELGNYREAGRYYAEVGLNEKAIESFQTLLDRTDNIQQLNFSDRELGIIHKHLAAGNTDPKLADALVAYNRLVGVIVELLQNGKTKEAAEVYLRSTSDIGPRLLSIDSFSEEDTRALAQLFTIVSNFEYAGMVYERLVQYQEAGESFEKCEDFERAAYCFERAGNKQAAIEMRCQLASRGAEAHATGKSPPEAEPKRKNPFVLSDTRTEAMPLTAVQTKSVDDDHTVVVPTGVIPAALLELTQENNMGANTGLIDSFAIGNGFSESNRTTFHKAEFLEELDYQQKNAIWSIAKKCSFKASEVIIDFNAEPAGIYFILTGSVACFKIIDGFETKVDSMSPPATIGEFWLLIDVPTKVKFVAETDCEIVVVERDEFMALLDRNGTIARKLYRRFTQKLLLKLINHQNQRPNKMAS